MPIAGVSLPVAIGFVLLLVGLLLRPPKSDLVALTLFLAISGGVTLLLGLSAPRMKMPGWFRSLSSRLILMSMLTATLALINVGFTALLMFISANDLALLAGLLGFSIAMCMFFAMAVAEPTVRSLRTLTVAVGRISSGDLQSRVTVESAGEVGELADAFNSMASRLEASIAKEREVAKTRQELITAVSHDLRTPLASIRAMVESLTEGVVQDQATVKRYLRNTLTEVENLGQLVNDLFELSQIDAGMLQLHIENASVQDLISDTLESMAAQAAAGGLQLHGEIQGEIAPVVMDLPRVQRVSYILV